MTVTFKAKKRKEKENVTSHGQKCKDKHGSASAYMSPAQQKPPTLISATTRSLEQHCWDSKEAPAKLQRKDVENMNLMGAEMTQNSDVLFVRLIASGKRKSALPVAAAENTDLIGIICVKLPVPGVAPFIFTSPPNPRPEK